ncbi:hypothetical protein Tsp_07362 [Trichinella spiralis]|uniref:hypothetical protein n=1 Tax=Trichinella spiralis TaxID=6334 RepID=UPI0001EFC940|nr:hypothetical protein Tsp_07362 [Trichinella spiralis]
MFAPDCQNGVMVKNRKRLLKLVAVHCDMPCIGDRPKVTVTPGVTNGDEDGMRQSTAVTPVDDHSTSFCRTPPPFPGNGDLKIWLMRLVDYFQENTIPEEKRYGFTKLLFSDEGYGMRCLLDVDFICRHGCVFNFALGTLTCGKAVTKILLEGLHNELIKAGILQAAPTTEEERGAVETLINQLLSRDPAACCLRLINRTYAAKQRQNQCGMSAFGSCRNAVLKPTAAAEKQAPSSSHNNDPFLSLFASTNVGASQKGMRSFGAHRENVSKSISSRQFSHDKAKITETIIPKQSIGSVASQLHLSAPIGSPRQHVMRIDSATGQKMDPMSNTFLTKSAAPNPNSHAGTSIMDRFRKQVLATDDKTEMHHDRQTESLLPRWSDRSGLVSPTGTGAGVSGLGPHRQVITHVIDQCPLTDEMITDSKKVVPWALSPSLQSQQGSGGFQKRRDVTSVTNY